MTYLGYLLNLPWTLLGLCNLVFCLPYKVSKEKDALVFHTVTCGLFHLQTLKVTGAALGNIVIVRKGTQRNILNHELIHIEQMMRYPFIFPLLNLLELARHGYWDNPYEIEAYNRSDSWPEYKKSSTLKPFEK